MLFLCFSASCKHGGGGTAPPPPPTVFALSPVSPAQGAEVWPLPVQVVVDFSKDLAAEQPLGRVTVTRAGAGQQTLTPSLSGRRLSCVIEGSGSSGDALQVVVSGFVSSTGDTHAPLFLDLTLRDPEARDTVVVASYSLLEQPNDLKLGPVLAVDDSHVLVGCIREADGFSFSLVYDVDAQAWSTNSGSPGVVTLGLGGGKWAPDSVGGAVSASFPPFRWRADGVVEALPSPAGIFTDIQSWNYARPTLWPSNAYTLPGYPFSAELVGSAWVTSVAATQSLLDNDLFYSAQVSENELASFSFQITPPRVVYRKQLRNGQVVAESEVGVDSIFGAVGDLAADGRGVICYRTTVATGVRLLVRDCSPVGLWSEPVLVAELPSVTNLAARCRLFPGGDAVLVTTAGTYARRAGAWQLVGAFDGTGIAGDIVRSGASTFFHQNGFVKGLGATGSFGTRDSVAGSPLQTRGEWRCIGLPGGRILVVVVSEVGNQNAVRAWVCALGQS